MRWMLALIPMTLIAEATLLGPADLAETGPQSAAYGITRDQFTLPSEVPGNPQVTCHVAWPVAADGSRPARQDDLVFYFQHPKERFYLPPKQSREWKAYEHLVTDGGFTVCGVFFENMAEEEIDVLNDRPRSYIFRESKSYPVLRAALDEVRRRYRVPARPVFTFGYSAGGILAQRFAEAYPDQVDSVASLGGRMFHQGGGCPAAHLLISTLGDTGEDDHAGLRRWLDLRGVAGSWIQTAPDWGKRGQDMFYHCTNRVATNLALRWIEGVADERRAGVPPAQASRWPYAADRRDQGRIVSTAQEGWRQLVPPGQEVWLPSAAAAKQWMSTPVRPSALMPGWTWAKPARAVEPRAVVVYRWRQLAQPKPDAGPDPTLARMPLLAWDAHQLADLGLVACISETAAFDPTALQQAVRAGGITDGLPVFLVEQADALGEPPAGLAARIVISPAAQATPELGTRALGSAEQSYQVRLLVLGDPKQPPQVWPRQKPAKPTKGHAPPPAERGRVLLIDNRDRGPQTVHGAMCQRISEVVAEHAKKSHEPARPLP